MSDMTISQDFVEATGIMNNPIMDSTAKAGSYSYRYASLASVLRAVRPALAAFKMSLVQGCEIMKAQDGSTVGMVLKTSVVHANGAWLTLDTRYIPINSNAQQFGSFETYMRRYALCSAFGLVGVEDDDGKMTVDDKEAILEAQAKAADAGKYLAESIAIYAQARDAAPDMVRTAIREKLAMTDELRNPDALIREGKALRQAAELVDGNVE